MRIVRVFSPCEKIADCDTRGTVTLTYVRLMVNSEVVKKVCCATTVLFAQAGAFGMEKTIEPAHEIGESVMVTDRRQLLSMTPEQAEKIKSLRIENQVIDADFRDFFLSVGELDSLCFCRCKVDCVTLSNVYVRIALGFVDCALTSKSAPLVLDDIVRWEYIETLDLSSNKIGVNPNPFCKWWKDEIAGSMTVKKLILSDNCFSENSKIKLFSEFKKYSPNCQVVF